MNKIYSALLAASICVLTACDEERIIDDESGDSAVAYGEALTPDFVTEIADWDGTLASDADTPGDDEDIYHEINSWTESVSVNFNGEQAEVTVSSPLILVHTDGAYVSVDMLTNSVAGVAVTVTGSTDNGALKFYGEKKFKLTLDGAHIASQKGAAINSQCKKRVFLHLAPGTANTISDSADYAEEPYYLASQNEDRKGCFFSEGNVVVSGTGALSIVAKNRHALASDGCLVVRPGATIVVAETAKNAIHVKGDSKDGIGVWIKGGYLHLTTAAAAGKGIKTDLGLTMTGGRVVVRTSGDAVYDEEEEDTSSAAAISTGGSVIISGGSLQLGSEGVGAKGFNVTGDFRFTGGSVDVWTRGARYAYTADLTSVAKAIKCDGNAVISGGSLNAASLGGDSGCDALDAKKNVTVSGGTVRLYASEDALSATSAINLLGGDLLACASGRAGITTRGTVTISGGTVRAYGGTAAGIAFDKTALLKVTGGNLLTLGCGSVATAANCLFTQCAAQTTGLDVAQAAVVAVSSASGNELLSGVAPAAYQGATLLVSSPDLTPNTAYTLSVAGRSVASFTPEADDLINF